LITSSSFIGKKNGKYNNNLITIMAEMAVILRGLATSNEGEAYGL